MMTDDGWPHTWTRAARLEVLEAEREQRAAAEARDWKTQELKSLRRRVARLEQTMAAMPDAVGEVIGRAMKNQSGMRYGGVFDVEQTYRSNTLVTSGGSLWLSLVEAEKGARPGRSPAWRLIAKAGSAADTGGFA